MEDNHKKVLSNLKSAGYKYISHSGYMYTYECKKGHTLIKHYNLISKFGFCLECLTGNNEIDEKVKDIESFGFKKVSFDNGLYKFECKNGHKFSRSYHSASKSGFCRECRITGKLESKKKGKK